MTNKTYWRRVVGSGLVSDKPAHLLAVIFTPAAAGDYVDVYNGRDATSGEKLMRVTTAVVTTQSIIFSEPIPCGRGLYVAGSSATVETAIAFELKGA